MRIAIVGAGIAGRLVAWQCQQQLPQAELVVFDKSVDNSADKQEDSSATCSFVAAGMLAPISELETEVDNSNLNGQVALPEIFQLGERSLELWPRWLSQLKEQAGSPVFYQSTGTLVVAHRQDRPYLQQLQNTLQHKLNKQFEDYCKVVNTQQVEPSLALEGPALFLKSEGQVDSHQVMAALETALKKIQWRNQKVKDLTAYNVDQEKFDWVFDCRGLGLQQDSLSPEITLAPNLV